MKIYDFPFAPNPRKLRVYLAEKSLEIPLEQINIVHGEQNRPGFRERNPAGGLPVLELDDGTCLSESLAIIEYLEELHPEPPMIGTTPLERARVRALERRAELGVLLPLTRVFHNTHAVLPGANPRSELADAARPTLERGLALLDQLVGDAPFVAGERPTIADCTLFAAFAFASAGDIGLDTSCKNLHRWHESFRTRPSALA